MEAGSRSPSAYGGAEPLTVRARAAFIAAFAAYGCIVIPLGVHKGDDILTHMAQADRMLRGLMVYDSPQTQGTWWPPFALLVVTPFAALAGTSLVLAKAAWGAVGLVALAWGVLVAGRRWGWRAALIALAVVIFPIHNNFHHLNIQTLLLVLLVAAAADLAAGRAARAGVWVGLATALKLFPGLLLPYFALRRQWKALAVGSGVAVAATVLALLPYGPGGALEALGNWVSLTIHGENFQGGTITGLHMQKLGRLAYAIGAAPASIVVLHLLVLAMVGATLALRPANPVADDAPLEVGAVALLSVLLAPIAWLHSFTLAYLAWVAALAHPPAFTGTARTAWQASLWIAGVHASTALSALTLPAWLRFFTWYNDVVGALLVLGLLLWQRSARARLPATAFLPRSPQPA